MSDQVQMQLSEIERLKMENFALKHNMLQSQLALITTERQAFIKSLEETHPGYYWDEQKGLSPIDKVEQINRVK